MKKTILTIAVALMTASSAQASFFAVSCSTASGGITHISGHIFSTTVTKYENHKKVRTTLSYEDEVLFEETGESVMLEEIENVSCQFGSWEKTYAVKAKLTKKGGFSDDILGAKNGVIETIFLCKQEVSSMLAPNENCKDSGDLNELPL